MSKEAIKAAQTNNLASNSDIIFYTRCANALKNNVDVDPRFTFNYSRATSDYIDDEMLLMANLTRDEISNISIEASVKKFVELITSCIHPSMISKYLSAGYDYLQNILKRNNLPAMKNNFSAIQELCSYVDFEFNIEEIVMRNAKDFQASVMYMNKVEPRYCGSVVECCIAEGFDAAYDWQEVYDYYKNLYTNDSKTYSMHDDEFKYLFGSEKWESTLYTVEHAVNGRFDQFAECFKLPCDIILFKAFMHYVMKDKRVSQSRQTYVEMFPEIDEFRKCVLKEFEKKGGSDFDTYANELKTDLQAFYKWNLMKDKQIIHNQTYKFSEVHLCRQPIGEFDGKLMCAGESDFECNDRILDAKCYKRVDEHVLRTWFYQLLIYSKLAGSINANIAVAECFHNVLYTFRGIKVGVTYEQIADLVSKLD